MSGNYRNRNHRGGGGGNFRGKRNFNSGGRGGGRRDKDESSKGQWQTSSRLSEPEAGISQFISNRELQFHGIIKSRYSDFVVNEIDLEENEAVLKNFDVIKPPEKIAELEDGPEKLLKDFITGDQLVDINELLGENQRALSSVSIDVSDYDKEKRAALHKCLKESFGKQINNETKAVEEKKFIIVRKSTKHDQQRAFGWQWPHEMTHFVIHKENVDTLQAIADLSNQLKVKPALFAYAGTKDKRGKTSQWISVRKMEPMKIFQAAKRCQGLRVGNFKFSPEPLRLGSLKGNRFRIALRSVKGDKEDIEKSLESLRDIGFINYYGLQRFGNCQKIPTHVIGKALLASDFKQAVELILQERDGEPWYMGKMRKTYADTKDAKQALECLHSTNTCVEARLLHGLVKHGGTNYLQALLNLPRNMLMLYTHAYQSFMWNQIASKRREIGLEVVEGDLVYAEDSALEEAAVEDVVATADDEDAKDEDVEMEETLQESKFLTMVRPLTKEDIDSKTFTIYDIVMPLPGFDIKYPSNETGATYVELLEKDNLSSEKLKSKHNVFSLTGAYRRVFVKPEKFSWKFMNYQKYDDELILSDISKIFNDPEPKDNPDGESLAIVLDFILPPSAYATMALREAMKSDTSVSNQINMETEVKKEMATTVNEADDDGAPAAKMTKIE